MYVVCIILCASARLICANGSCYVVLSSSVEGWSQHNNNIILYTHITTTRHILAIWLGNSRSRIRSSSSHAILCFPVGLPKIAFTPCVLVVDVKSAATILIRDHDDLDRFFFFDFHSGFIILHCPRIRPV
uniref:Secreted protein n=1 Tax=Schizaphis graminum TaxID=13262 RepID=A0A2S2NIC9_SCHGA